MSPIVNGVMCLSVKKRLNQIINSLFDNMGMHLSLYSAAKRNHSRWCLALV